MKTTDNKHQHQFTRSKPSATVETCRCGKFRFTENAGPSIEGTPMKTTDNKIQPAPMRVKHIQPHFLLVTNSQDIDACLEVIGQTAIREECGCLFVEVLDGEYGTIYGCERSIPYLDEPVFAIQ